MKRDTAIEVIMARLGNRTGLEEMAVREMQLAQDRLESGPEMPWFLEATATASVAIDATMATLPTLYKRTHEDGLWIRETGTTDAVAPITKIDFPELLKFRKDATVGESGIPDRYALWGTTLELYPVADKAYDLIHYHYAKGALLETNIENLWLEYAPDLMIAETGIVIAMFARDDSAVQVFSAQRADAQERLIRDTVAREEAGRVQRMGG